MEILTLGNHVVRKALRLSLNEMAVLCDIHRMSNNRKFNGWCIKSKSSIAEWLDLGDATVFRAIKALEEKKYIQKNERGDTRVTDWLLSLTHTDNIAVYIQNNEIELISANLNELYNDRASIKMIEQSDSNSIKMIEGFYQNDRQDNINNKKKESNQKVEGSTTDDPTHEEPTTASLSIKANGEMHTIKGRVVNDINNFRLTFANRLRELEPMQFDELVEEYWQEEGQYKDKYTPEYQRRGFVMFLQAKINGLTALKQSKGSKSYNGRQSVATGHAHSPQRDSAPKPLTAEEQKALFWNDELKIDKAF